MEKTNLKDLIKAGEHLARQQLLVNGVPQLLPMFHLVSPEKGKDLVIGCQWGSPKEKYEMVEGVKEEAHKMGAVAAMFVTEAWVSQHPVDAILRNLDPPSQQPNREEVVMVFAIDNEGNQEMGNWVIVRDRPGGTIIELVKRKELEGVYQANIIEGLLPPKKEVV